VLRRQRTVSVNSYLRQSRALFSNTKVLSKIRSIELPEQLSFVGVASEKRVDQKFYGAGIDPMTLVRAAMKELSAEPLKAFLLANTLGLRRQEVDMLEWQSIDFATATLRIVPTKWYALKTHESAAELPIEPRGFGVIPRVASPGNRRICD
jgi:hypothetical protein